MTTPTPTLEAAQEPLKVVAYLVTGLRSGEPSICFEDERGDYGDEDHAPVFDALCRLSDHEASIRAKDAEIAALKADAGRIDALEAVTVENQWIVAKNLDSFTASLGRSMHATRRTLREAIDAAIDAIKGDANAD